MERERTGDLVEFGRWVNQNTFRVRSIEGNFFTLSPIKISAALNFLHDPSELTRKRFVEQDPNQLSIFSDSELETRGYDLPVTLYKWISLNEELEMDEIEDKIGKDISQEYLKYVNNTKEYFKKVSPLGIKSSFSNLHFGLNIFSTISKFELEGQGKSQSIDIIGMFDEIRKGEKSTLVRIRQNNGNPSLSDAIKISLQLMAYKAFHPESGLPSIKVFNLTDGKLYKANLDLEKIIKESLNAITLSDLSARAGYFESKIVTQESSGKKIYLHKNGKKISLTAEEAFKKANNCLRRINGELPYSDRLFSFIEEN